MILEPITYKGGLYRHEEMVELIEDLGGYIIQLQQIAGDIVILALVPKEDLDLVRAVAKPINGEVKVSPLVGTEIAVVSMSLEIHHLPHATCDVAEYPQAVRGKDERHRPRPGLREEDCAAERRGAGRHQRARLRHPPVRELRGVHPAQEPED